MEVYEFGKAVKVFTIEAKAFPENVKEAWQTLHGMLPSVHNRTFYGISHGNRDGGITYKAAVEEEFAGEAEKYRCEITTIPAGDYMSITVHDYPNHVQLIGQAFRRLISHPEFDGITPCIEWYKNDKEVVCMVRKK